MTLVLIPLNDLMVERQGLKRFKPSHQSLDVLKTSIVKVGLLNPLVVTKRKSKYIVLNGRKRLNVLRELAKSHLYTQSLHKIPCITEIADTEIKSEQKRPILLRAPELAHAILTDINSGRSSVRVAQKYECDLHIVKEAVSFQGLHADVLKHFDNEAISWEQAAAFATIPNPDAQLSLLLQLGPFVSDQDIIKAIHNGDTVIELPDGNTILLPSRAPRQAPNFNRQDATQKAKQCLAA